MEANNKHYIAYNQLRNTIDQLSDKLGQEHKSYMQCNRGCDLCCMDYSILPLEFHFIRNDLKKNGEKPDIKAPEVDSTQCIFLKNHECTIYRHRPVICRTHGLPLLYTNDDYEWELSTCELNFRQFDYKNFNPDNTYPQDIYNSKLLMLNKAFIAEPGNEEYGEFDLIPVKQLAANL